MAGYTAKINDGRDIYNEIWLPTVALENLSKVGKYIGLENLLAIVEINKMSVHTVILAIADADNSETTMNLIKHFVCTIALDGTRIDANTFDQVFTGKLDLVIELFCHVCKAQYSDFLESGLVKA